MEIVKAMSFNNYKIDGWKCSCGEIYYNPEQLERILIINKLKKQLLRAKLGKIRSNLILRLPKSIEAALGLKQGQEVSLKITDKGVEITK